MTSTTLEKVKRWADKQGWLLLQEDSNPAYARFLRPNGSAIVIRESSEGQFSVYE